MLIFFPYTGVIEAVARDFFDCEVSLEILEQNVEEERTGKKEHVVFFILQTNGTVKPNIEEQAISVCEDGSQKDKEVMMFHSIERAEELIQSRGNRDISKLWAVFTNHRKTLLEMI